MWVRWSLGFALAVALAGCGGGGVPERVSGRAPAQYPAGRAAQPEAPPIRVTVDRGDTVASLADRYQVSIRDLIDANRLEPPYQLTPGQSLLIPSSRTHRVMRGETLYGIARHYRTDLSTVARLNRLGPPYRIYEGQSLRIPRAVAPPTPVTTTAVEPSAPAPAAAKPGIEVSPLPAPAPSAQPPAGSAPPGSIASAPAAAPPPAPRATTPSSAPPPPVATSPQLAPPAAKREPDPPAAAPQPQTQTQTAALPPARAGSLQFAWPASGRIISGFGPKPGGQHNDGINIEVARGAPVRAAESGTVVYAGNELKGYGNLVLIRHAGGWVTAYAHNDQILVRRGAQITKGQTIARAGSSGGVATPQVHFEVRRGREPVDPLRYLGVQEAVSGAAGRGDRPSPG
jgi:murein DD-endopeptidase MepM/ murein hydrolase activator NlpD